MFSLGYYCSEFSDIFDLDHFKNVLANDVRIVSSLPSTHLMTRAVEEKRTPLHASSEWIRSHYLKKVTQKDSVLNSFCGLLPSICLWLPAMNILFGLQ